ncbi:MAG: hypothetical protein ABWY05_03945, partial [Noviherbaspirillum sp.]
MNNSQKQSPVEIDCSYQTDSIQVQYFQAAIDSCKFLPGCDDRSDRIVNFPQEFRGRLQMDTPNDQKEE